MNGFSSYIYRLDYRDFVLFWGLFAGICLLMVPQAGAQVHVWQVDTAIANGVLSRTVAGAEVKGYSQNGGWHYAELGDDAKISWNMGRDTMFINARAAVGAYVSRDPTTAEALLAVKVTGFGTPKLSIEWEMRAKAFDNPGGDPQRIKPNEVADAFVGAILELPLSVVTDTTLGGSAVAQAGMFDLSYEWNQRIFLNLSDSGVGDGSANATSRVRFTGPGGLTSIFGPDAGLFVGRSLTERILRDEGVEKKTIDLTRNGFGSHSIAGTGTGVRIDLAGTGEFVRGSSSDSELHVSGYVFGSLDLYIDRHVSGISGGETSVSDVFGLE